MALCLLMINLFFCEYSIRHITLRSYNSTKSQNSTSNGETAGDNSDNI